MPAINTIVSLQPEFSLVEPARLKSIRPHTYALWKIVWMYDAFPTFTDHIPGRLIEVLQRSRINVIKLTVRISRPNLMEDAFTQLSVSIFAFLQCVFGTLSLGNVTADSLDADRNPVTKDQPRAQFQRNPPAVFREDIDLVGGRNVFVEFSLRHCVGVCERFRSH